MQHVFRRTLVVIAFVVATLAAAGCDKDSSTYGVTTPTPPVTPTVPIPPATPVTVNVNFHVHSNCIGENITGATISAPNASASTDSLGNARLLLVANTTVTWTTTPPTPNPSGYTSTSGIVNAGSSDSTTPVDVTLNRQCGGTPTTPTPTTPSCVYYMQTSLSVPHSGMSNVGWSVNPVPTTCTGKATTTAPWIKIRVAYSPIGFNFDVDANTGSMRQGTISVGNQALILTQP